MFGSLESCYLASALRSQPRCLINLRDVASGRLWFGFNPPRCVGGRRFVSCIPASRQLQYETLTALNCKGRLVIHRQSRTFEDSRMCPKMQSAISEVRSASRRHALPCPWLLIWKHLRILIIVALRMGFKYKGGALFLKGFRIGLQSTQLYR